MTACSAGTPATKTTTYEPPNNPGGRLCVTQCNQARDYCQQSCNFDNRQCIGEVQIRALRDYEKYTREQFEAREPIELRPRDFERMAPCDDDKKRCSARCERGYQACYGNCGGQVNIDTSCKFMCF